MWLGDYSFFKTNAETLPIASLSAMQYGRALDRLIREIVYADPALIEKGQWVILPYSVAKGLPGLRLSPLGVKVERDWRPRWLGDHSFF